MANEPRPLSQGKIIEDAVSVFLGGQAFDGWEAVGISKNLSSIANTFNLSINDRFSVENQAFPLKPGVEVAINVNDERVITGTIEQLSNSYSSGERSIQASGRSRAGDLVDCSVSEPFEYTNIGIEELANRLVKDYGLKVFLSVTPPSNLDKFSLKPSETVFQALDRAARLQGFMWVSTREGNIRLTQAGVARSDSELHEDVNIKSGTLSLDDSKRFQNYKVIGQMSGSDEFSGASAASPQGSATDNGIKRFRPKTIIAEGPVDSQKAGIRAGWEVSVRNAQSQRIELTVQGWRQQTGALWGVNQIVRVNVLRLLGLNRDMLIDQVNHTQDGQSGTETTMNLIRKDAYASKPVFEEADDWLADLGLG